MSLPIVRCEEDGPGDQHEAGPPGDVDNAGISQQDAQEPNRHHQSGDHGSGHEHGVDEMSRHEIFPELPTEQRVRHKPLFALIESEQFFACHEKHAPPLMPTCDF